MKGDVRARVAHDRAVERAVPQANELATAARSSSLEAAAAAQKLTVQKTGIVNRSGAASAFATVREALGAAFALPVGSVSVPIRERDAVYVLRVDASKPADRGRRGEEEGALGARSSRSGSSGWAYFEDLRTAKIDDRRKEIAARRSDSR